MDKQKVYYRIAEIAKKFGISQEQMAEILKKNGINEVLPGIYDRDSFRGKVNNVRKMVKDYKEDKQREHIVSIHNDGYMNINEIAEVFGTDVSCIRRKINKLKLPYITGIRGEKRYHDTVIDKHAHVMKKGNHLPNGKKPILRNRGYITYSEFEILAGITRITLNNRIRKGIYSDCIMVDNICYIHRRNLNIQPVRHSSIISNTPDGYIPLVTIRKILGLVALSIQKYIRDGVINPLYVINKSGHVYLKREEAERFVEWYKENRRKHSHEHYDNVSVTKGIGVILSDY